MLSGYALICCQFVFGLVFAVSLASKVRSRAAYAAFVAAVPGLAPGIPVRLAAPAVIAGEAAVVVLVVIPATAVVGFALAVALLLSFTVAIVAAIRRRQKVTCQCFGSSSSPVGPPHVARNAVLLLIALTGLAAGLDPGQAMPGLGVLVSAVLTGAVAAGAVLLTDEIADLFRPNH
ncbi:hypothetical protein OG394_22790 [Kribbella sp. NBC_01245]|uniref:MauE/DoxX family redox-associated membrane protein n=1 Tax=Kribbella sp. NBC_01245 TaxID=2903578 RepID=UPI002E298C86|nr:MauE/DoxX family redox-associated membrane protein [Kribbella sp. NBC_01245]